MREMSKAGLVSVLPTNFHSEGLTDTVFFCIWHKVVIIASLILNFHWESLYRGSAGIQGLKNSITLLSMNGKLSR